MYKNDKVIRRYSEPFKLKILAELSTGKYTKSELGKRYSIAPTTINKWIRKYERKDLMNTRVKWKLKTKLHVSKRFKKKMNS
jgi:transposase-like protein